MIVRKLTCMEHEEYGGEGWSPDWWLKGLGFEPSSGFGVSHDIFEHMVDKIGGAEGEFMAFGAMCWGRGDGGWFYGHGMHQYGKKFKDMMASYFPEVLKNIANGEQSLKDPGKTRALRDEDHWEEEMNYMIKHGIQEFIVGGEMNYDTTIDQIPFSINEIHCRILGWMRKGFRAARDYYARHRIDPCGLSYIFDEVTAVVDKESKGMEIGEILTIRIDFRHHRVSGYKTYSYE